MERKARKKKASVAPRKASLNTPPYTTVKHRKLLALPRLKIQQEPTSCRGCVVLMKGS